MKTFDIIPVGIMERRVQCTVHDVSVCVISNRERLDLLDLLAQVDPKDPEESLVPMVLLAPLDLL